VPSASPHAPRLAAVATCALLLPAGLAGCTTTQEKATEKQAQSERILERHERAREQRQAERKRRRG